jgi:hypothetical protein
MIVEPQGIHTNDVERVLSRDRHWLLGLPEVRLPSEDKTCGILGGRMPRASGARRSRNDKMARSKREDCHGRTVLAELRESVSLVGS